MEVQIDGLGDEPLVVIGIPTFNRVSLLERCIASALAQTYPRVQVLVSDNASADGTEDFCRAYAARDARLCYFRQAENVGATRNFLTLRAKAEAPLYMCLADDDWIDPDFVRRCVAALRADPSLVMVGARACYDDGRDPPEGQPVTCTSRISLARVLSYYRQVDDNTIFYGVVRHEMVRRIDVINTIGGDWLYMAALAAHGGLRTVDGVFLHRERDGISRDKRELAAMLGEPAWKGFAPVTLTVAVNAVADVMTNRAYDGKPRWWRMLLALLLLPWIFAFKPLQELRRRWRARAVA